MRKLLEAKSTLTDRYQTTIPEAIREALHLEKRDKITYVIEENGKVVISRTNENDPDIHRFLNLLTKDIKNNKNIKTISPGLLHRAQSLTSDVDIDLESPLSEKDE